MSLLEDKVVPGREERVEAAIAFGGSACGLGNQEWGCLKNQERSFSQSGLCQMLPTLGMLLTLPDSVVVIHGAVGCASTGIGALINIRLRHVQRGNLNASEGVWVSTNLDENDVVHGGEAKLEQTIFQVYHQFHPKSIIVVQTCTPAVIGDDVAGVVDRARKQLDIPVLAAFCEGFKTKVWASGYDVAFHAIVHGFIEKDREGKPSRRDPRQKRERPLVNLINLASVGKPDEDELERLLNLIGIDVNIGPNFATRDAIRNMTQADLTISICPTHDDYLVDYLHQEYGIPFILKEMPVGLENTRNWLLDIASHFQLTDRVKELVDAEERRVRLATQKYLPFLAGKRVFLSAGEFRALVTGRLFQELGLEVVGLRSYHHDNFGREYYGRLVEAQGGKDFVVDIANFQPFELTNLLNTTKPDLFAGHIFDNIWAAKQGLPTLTIFRVFDRYLGYQGFYDVAKKTARILRNSSFNQKLAQNVTLPYRKDWYSEDPFKYIKSQSNLEKAEPGAVERRGGLGK